MKTSANIRKSILVIAVVVLSIASNARNLSFEITPAKATSFTAVLNNNKVDLKWSTETETNLSHFIVERSTDGINYNDAALVFAYGNTTAKSDYALADNISRVKSTTIYYRITSIGADGKTQCSDIRTIQTKK
jgi:hypothetical protein